MGCYEGHDCENSSDRHLQELNADNVEHGHTDAQEAIDAASRVIE